MMELVAILTLVFMSAFALTAGIPDDLSSKDVGNTPVEEQKKESADVPAPATGASIVDQYVSSGKLNEAIDEISRELPGPGGKEALNKSLSAIRDKAVQAARGGEYNESLAVLDRLLDIGYEKNAVIADKMIILVWAGKYAEAVELYEKYRKNNTPDFNLLNTIGSAYRKTGKYPEAIRCCDESLALNKDNPDAVKGKVFSLIASGGSAEAYEFIRNEMKERRDSPAWLNLLTGEAYLVEGRNDEAETFFS